MRGNERSTPQTQVDFQFCQLVEPSGEGWEHEIKFECYRVQLRVQNEQATL
jgi:bifunctional non-homologous end joining protein LigD